MSIATEVERLQTAKADIRQALIDKGADVPSTDTIDEYAGYIQDLSNGDVANGVIEEYLASAGTVDANTFVEFVKGIDSPVVNHPFQISESNYSSAIYLGAFSATKALIVYTEGPSNTNRPLFARVLNIGSDGSVTAGTAVMLADNIYVTADVRVWSDTSFVVVSSPYTVSTGNSRTVTGVVCSVSGQNITVGTGVALSTPTLWNQQDSNRVLPMTATKAIVVHPDVNRQVRGYILTRTSSSATTFTVGNVFTTSLITGIYQLYLARWSDSYALCIAVLRDSSNNQYSVVVSSIFVSGTATTSSFQDPYTLVAGLSASPSVYPLGELSSNGGVYVRVGSTVYLCSVSSNGYNVVEQSPSNSPTLASCFAGVCFGSISLFAANSSYIIKYTLSGYTPVRVGYSILPQNSMAVYMCALLPPFSTSTAGAVLASSLLSSSPNTATSATISVFQPATTTTIKRSATKIDGLTKTEATTATPGEVFVLG